MDFEWEKLINGESDIDADDINALADGIIENEKEIKAIKDIMDNGGTIPEYLIIFFKEIPEGMTIDDLDGRHLGCYLIEETQNVYGHPCDVKYLLFVNDGMYANNEEQRDEAHIFQTRYYFNAYNGIVKIQTRMNMYNEAAGLWEDWQDVFATPQYVLDQIAKIPTGGEVKYFPYKPQLDITLQEGVQKILVNELDGKSWSDFKFTAVKVLVENAVLETAGPNTQVCVYINSRGYTSTQTVLGSPTTFINGTTKQYWSCYADLKSGLMITSDQSLSNELWASGISMPINMQRLNLKNILEYISIEYMNANGMFPVGTRFRIWLR